MTDMCMQSGIYITWHDMTWDYITLRYVTLRYITFHYIHFITIHYHHTHIYVYIYEQTCAYVQISINRLFIHPWSHLPTGFLRPNILQIKTERTLTHRLGPCSAQRYFRFGPWVPWWRWTNIQALTEPIFFFLAMNMGTLHTYQ